VVGEEGGAGDPGGGGGEQADQGVQAPSSLAAAEGAGRGDRAGADQEGDGNVDLGFGWGRAGVPSGGSAQGASRLPWTPGIVAGIRA
jgi:hypothetical protein